MTAEQNDDGGGCQFGKDTRKDISEVKQFIEAVQRRMRWLVAGLFITILTLFPIFKSLAHDVEARSIKDINEVAKQVEKNRSSLVERREMTARLDERLRSIESELKSINKKLDR